MKLVRMVSVVLAALLGLAVAQTGAPPAFDVASIRPDEGGGNYIDVTPGSLSAHSATLTTCIMWAYGVQASQVSAVNSAVSGLLQSDRYTIIAKTAGPA